MINPKNIAKRTMSPNKKATAFNDFFAFYVGRPLSYVLTVPFLYLKVQPKTVSIISMVFPILGFLCFALGNSKIALILGWVMFFLWNLLDGVDGNIARYTHATSKIGSVYDAMSGYISMILTFFSAGIGAAHMAQPFISFDPSVLIVLGALSGNFVLFPRLVMHKKISTYMDESVVEGVKDKAKFGIIKIIALNLASVSGGAQVLMLAAVLFNILNLYTIGYFIFNLLVMLVSLKSIFTE